MNHKTYFFNMLRFYKWGVDFNSGKLQDLISNFFINRRITFVDKFFAKYWEAYSLNLYYNHKDFCRSEMARFKQYYDRDWSWKEYLKKKGWR